MSEEPKRNRSEEAIELDHEIRRDRKFTLSEAIGRSAGPGAMKGASPVEVKRQAEAELDDLLRRHLTDSDGCLRPVLRRRVSESDLLLANPEQPRVVLETYVRRVLESDFMLRDLVRDLDVEWGRLHDERPHFDTDDKAPHPDDPYTFESVRVELSALVDKLTGGVVGRS